MKVNIHAIKELRERTGAGVIDCRTALETTEGDLDAALVLLKEQGLLQAQKLQKRTTNEGRVFVRSNNVSGAVLRLACETDFVARSEVFLRVGEQCLDMVLAHPGCQNELPPLLLEASSRTHENVVLCGLKTVQAARDERIFTYMHGEGRIGVALVLAIHDSPSWDRPDVQELAADLTLQVAAFGPLYLSRDTVDSVYLEQKKAEYIADARALGKPERMIAPIADGKLNKHLSQICLLEQGYIRDEGANVRTVLSALKDAGGPEVTVKAFAYERVGT
jgi:elongation factor Ts